MAYAQSALTVASYTIAGRRYHRIAWTETGVTTATDGTADAEITGMPAFGSILSVKATLTSGSGATINPRLGVTDGFTVSTQNHIGTAATTAAHVNEQGQTYFYTSTSSIFWRSLPNAGTDNAVSVELIIAEGAP